MPIQFHAQQTVEIHVPEQPVPIRHYLRQPQRLVNALADPTRIERLSSETFRLKMRPLQFMDFSLQPTVDFQVKPTSDGTIYLRSIACEIRGIEYVNQRFQLELVGHLKPYDQPTGVLLKGMANLTVRVDLPPPLWLTPTPLLEAAGNGLLKSVLITIKQRLQHQLLADYQIWASGQETKTNQIEDWKTLGQTL